MLCHLDPLLYTENTYAYGCVSKYTTRTSQILLSAQHTFACSNMTGTKQHKVESGTSSQLKICSQWELYTVPLHTVPRPPIRYKFYIRFFCLEPSKGQTNILMGPSNKTIKEGISACTGNVDFFFFFHGWTHC